MGLCLVVSMQITLQCFFSIFTDTLKQEVFFNSVSNGDDYLCLSSLPVARQPFRRGPEYQCQRATQLPDQLTSATARLPSWASLREPSRLMSTGTPLSTAFLLPLLLQPLHLLSSPHPCPWVEAEPNGFFFHFSTLSRLHAAEHQEAVSPHRPHHRGAPHCHLTSH